MCLNNLVRAQTYRTARISGHTSTTHCSHKSPCQPLESFWFTGANKTKVQGFLLKPPNFDANKKYPVKLLIHGGPQGAWGDDWSFRWNPELFAANGYVVVMINPRGSTGYGQKFIDEINGDWGGKPFVDLMMGLDYAEQKYPFIDKNRECALGASYGGYMVDWILGHTDRFKCLVSHDGMFDTISALRHHRRAVVPDCGSSRERHGRTARATTNGLRVTTQLSSRRQRWWCTGNSTIGSMSPRDCSCSLIFSC